MENIATKGIMMDGRVFTRTFILKNQMRGSYLFIKGVARQQALQRFASSNLDPFNLNSTFKT